MRLGAASTPPGMRLYAIGDVHGCDAALGLLHQAILGDLETRPVGDHRIVHVGDYVDRGPDSKAVLERLVAMTAADERILCLRGNHEDILTGFLLEPLGAGALFLRNGGVETLASYGIAVDDRIAERGLPALRDRLAQALPRSHAGFLFDLASSVRFGDYFFCHAGIRPGVALDAQDPHDLAWIREPFLSDPRDHGAVIVHGHTPTERPVLRPNRIGIDTGCFVSGLLTCLVLEGTAHRFL